MFATSRVLPPILDALPIPRQAEDLRLFQVEQRDAGLGMPTMNSIVSALRFFFTHTIDRPDLSRKLHTVKNPRSLPIVLSLDEVAQLLGATTCLKHKAALTPRCTVTLSFRAKC